MTGSDLKADLRRYLQAARDALLWKLEGLSEYDVRRPLVPTGTNLLAWSSTPPASKRATSAPFIASPTTHWSPSWRRARGVDASMALRTKPHLTVPAEFSADEQGEDLRR